MKKYILWSAGLAVLIFAIWFFSGTYATYKKLSAYPDAEGWSRKVLQGDELAVFLPTTLEKGFYLLSPDESGVVDSENRPAPGEEFVEYREGANIKLGSAGSPTAVAKALRALYALEGFDEMPVFKIWVEQISAKDFPEYKNSVLKQLQSYEGEIGEAEKMDYRGREYYVYLRKDLSPDGLKGKNSIGGAYIFFPEENRVVYIYLFNTRFNSPSAYLISKQELRSVLEQIIDSSAR